MDEPDRCEHCAIARGRQMNVTKKTDHVASKKVGERLYLDVADVMQNQNSDASVDSTSKRYWQIMVDEASQFKISDFLISKHAMIDATCEEIFNFKQENKIVKYIQCDYTGQNQGLKSRLQSANWKMPIKFEFTGHDTPQRNHLAKEGLAKIASRGRAIMSAAAIPKELHQNFWREAFQTSTYLDGLVLVEIDGVLKTQFEHWEATLPQFLQYLRKWGEARVVKFRTSTTPKIYDRRKVCMFVGYSPNHAGNGTQTLNKYMKVEILFG
jgi:hypothetical protein